VWVLCLPNMKNTLTFTVMCGIIRVGSFRYA